MFCLIFCYFQLMMVAFLFLAVLILLPFLLYLWCTNRSLDTPTWLPTPTRTLRKLKKLKLGRDKDIAADKDEGDFCSICLATYKHSDYVTMLPCDPRHAFHT